MATNGEVEMGKGCDWVKVRGGAHSSADWFVLAKKGDRGMRGVRFNFNLLRRQREREKERERGNENNQ